MCQICMAWAKMVCSATANAGGRSSASMGTTDCHWEAPPAGWVKLNTDGSMHSPTKESSIGGVFKDDIGRWLCGFYQYTGVGEVFQRRREEC